MNSESLRCIRAGFGYYTFEVDDYRTFLYEVVPLFVRPLASHDCLDSGRPQAFVWRGMRDPSWLLQSSLSRFASTQLRSTGNSWQRDVCRMTTQHLVQFIRHLRGLGLLSRKHDELHAFLESQLAQSHLSFLAVIAPLSSELKNLVYELFALGQHYQLLTPFLDWTSIPAVALYFAFKELDDRTDGVGHRVVFALNQTEVETLCPASPGTSNPEDANFIFSMAHDNARIVGQAGLFTFVPAHLPLDQWVVNKVGRAELAPPRPPVLIRFLIHNHSRGDCLRELALSGIHARTVFPDRFGAAEHANFSLELP